MSHRAEHRPTHLYCKYAGVGLLENNAQRPVNRAVHQAAEASEEVRRAALGTLDQAIGALIRPIEEINYPGSAS